MVGMVITLSVYLSQGIISIPAPLFKRGWHFIAAFLHFCCRWLGNRLSGYTGIRSICARYLSIEELIFYLPSDIEAD